MFWWKLTSLAVFAQNITEAILIGKAYYQTVQQHIWTYEALKRIWWTKFVEWLLDGLCEDGRNCVGCHQIHKTWTLTAAS